MLIINEYIDSEGFEIKEYSRDGKTISAIIRQPVPIESEQIEPEPIVSPPTIEEKLASLEQQLQDQQQQNLILVDINLTVYEELLNMKDQIVQLTGAKYNA